MRRLKRFLALLLMLCLLGSLALSEAAEATVTPAATPTPARGYILVTTATQYGWLPLAAEGESYDFPITQQLADGTIAVNLVHVTDHGMSMAESTCDNQDCVDEGEVTLENREQRILGNMILCLPHQVMLQLFTPEEVLALVLESQQAENGAPEEK